MTMKEEPAIEELERDIKEQVFLLGFEKLFELLGKTKKISSFDLFVLFFKRKMQFNVSCDKYSICKLGIPLSGETSEFVDDLIAVFEKHKKLIYSKGSRIEIQHHAYMEGE
jgi:hypothetical protein